MKTSLIRLLAVCLVLPALALATTDVNAVSPFGRKSNSVAARKQVAATPQVYVTEHFAIVYSTSGAHAVGQAGLGLDGNGMPRVIDSLGKLAEQVWRLAIDTLGYPVPVALDSALGLEVKVPAGKFPVELMDLVTLVPDWINEGYMGYASQPAADPQGHSRLELLLENDFVEGGSNKPLRVIVDPINNHGDSVLIDYSKDPLKGWAVALAHEFYHTLQYHWDSRYTYAFHEMTATWFATRAFPKIHHEWQYLQRFVNHMQYSAFRSDSTYPYDDYVFVSAAVKSLGEGVLKELWPDHASNFSGEEAIWFHGALIRLGKNEASVNMEYVNDALSLIGNAPSHLNCNGSIQIKSPILKQWPVITDSTTNSMFDGVIWYGVELISLSRQQFANGWNVVLVDGIDSSASVGGLLSLPSKLIRVDCPKMKRLIYGRPEGDTAMVLAALPSVQGKYSWSAGFKFTTAQPNSIRQHGDQISRNHPRYQFDLRGRPVTSSARGIVLEGDAQSGWHRKVIVGE